MNETDPTVPAADPAVGRATWMIGVAAALTLGMAIGVAVDDVATPGGRSPVSSARLAGVPAASGAPCVQSATPARAVEVSHGR